MDANEQKQNEQKVFDRVLNHLRTQGKASSNAAGDCLYRYSESNTGKTLSCAIGCLIPDEAYNPKIEQALADSFRIAAAQIDDEIIEDISPTRYLAHRRVGKELNKLGVSYDFLSMLQDIHDNAAGVSTRAFQTLTPGQLFLAAIEKDFSEMAIRQGLTYTPPQPKLP